MAPITSKRSASVPSVTNLKSLFSKPRLRFCLRATISALLAFGLAQVFTIPLRGLWAVLTAVVVTQMSIGGSLKATADYVIGTIGGAVYACAIAALVPHTTPLAIAGVLALAIGPLAYAAVLIPSFRVAPFTAVLVLMISTQLGETPIESAFDRLLEVIIGGAVAMTVSLLIFPARARALGLDAGARVLECLARALPRLLAGFQTSVDPLEILRDQDAIGQAVDAFNGITEEAERERSLKLATEPDLAVLARTLLRLRHDFVMIGRATSAPLLDRLAVRLGPKLAQIGATAGDYLLANASSLTSRHSAPPVEPVTIALANYASEIASIRAEGLLQDRPVDEIECIFVLEFALQQLQQNFSDLAQCVQDWALK